MASCRSLLPDILTSVSSQDFIDQGLISDAAPARFLAELIEHPKIDSNRDQLARLMRVVTDLDVLY